jgi:AcrR family transcriptional regulator
MPAAPKTSDTEVVLAARRIVDEVGAESLSMSAVAEAVGIRAPSLYKRFADREAIIRAVKVNEFAILAASIDAAVVGLAPVATLREIGRQYWHLAHNHRHLYAILFAQETFEDEADKAIRSKALVPVLNASRALIGNDLGLAAARTLTAYIHGFLALEAAGAYYPSKITEGSYFFGISTIIKGLTVST